VTKVFENASDAKNRPNSKMIDRIVALFMVFPPKIMKNDEWNMRFKN
jgi:hypothetical protein